MSFEMAMASVWRKMKHKCDSRFTHIHSLHICTKWEMILFLNDDIFRTSWKTFKFRFHRQIHLEHTSLHLKLKVHFTSLYFIRSFGSVSLFHRFFSVTITLVSTLLKKKIIIVRSSAVWCSCTVSDRRNHTWLDHTKSSLCTLCHNLLVTQCRHFSRSIWNNTVC